MPASSHVCRLSMLKEQSPSYTFRLCHPNEAEFSSSVFFLIGMMGKGVRVLFSFVEAVLIVLALQYNLNIDGLGMRLLYAFLCT